MTVIIIGIARTTKSGGVRGPGFGSGLLRLRAIRQGLDGDGHERSRFFRFAAEEQKRWRRIADEYQAKANNDEDKDRRGLLRDDERKAKAAAQPRDHLLY